jgi:hypothetical protein
MHPQQEENLSLFLWSVAPAAPVAGVAQVKANRCLVNKSHLAQGGWAMPLDKVPESEFPDELLPHPVRRKADDIPQILDISYEELPHAVKNNLTPRQWAAAQGNVIPEGGFVPQGTVYMNLKNGQCRFYEFGERAPAPLLATHDLAGGRGADDTQFHTAPPDYGGP